TLECVTERAGVDRESADFVLPLGATLNMDGTALYEAVAAVFIANALGFDLTFAQQVVIVLTATLAAIGAAGVPSAGLVTMIIVLESVGLPGAGYALVVAVDRILDMCRTTVNVWGDSVGAAVVDRLLGDPEAKA
ncbi:MAG: dicarboxylate/amino acid:cation symporter, partial [Persicimonas sp.]